MKNTATSASGRVGIAAFAAALIAVWLLADPRTPDLAAQVYRVDVYRQLGFTVWDERWYAGHHVPGYSLLFPPLGALLGIKLVGGLSVLASSVLFERLARSCCGNGARWGDGAGARWGCHDGARWGAAWFAVAALGDVWSGRVTFALGVALALAAVLALRRGHPVWAGVLAALCACASPVAGAFLGLVGLTVALSDRSPRALLALAAPAAVVVLALVVLFPEGGYEPFPALSFAVTALVTVAFVCALPREAMTLRIGGLLYLVACVGCVLVHTPVGSNVERYGVLLAGPLLLCARLRGPAGGGDRKSTSSAAGLTWTPTVMRVAESKAATATSTVTPAAMATTVAVATETTATTRAAIAASVATAAALCTTAVWLVWGPVRETLAVAGSEATSASYYVPVKSFLAGAAAARGPVRVEVPLTRSHWEAALLADDVSLARGWEKQLDTRFDRVLLTPGLTAASYHGWLREQAVAYVALPDVRLDPSSSQEGRLIRAGLPYLREAFASAHWRVYRVLAPTPLLSGAGTLLSLGHDSFVVRSSSAGSLTARVRYSRYLTLTHGSGCVGRAPGGWTDVRLDAAGTATVTARFSLARALGTGDSCTRKTR
ncbi:MAG TPA: hypothetical protein VFY36_06395 [Solirubrobacteraceae bacterium]|nr:hypothetical protein [Solirubrobacteraceae bacterium]